MKEEILASQTPPDNQVSEREVQQRKARIVAAIRKPIPDLSAKFAELRNSPEMLPLSLSEPTTGTVKEEILTSQTPPDNQVSERELQQRKARIVAAIRKPLPVARVIEGAVSDRVSEVSRLEVTKVPVREVAAEFTPYQIPLMP